MNAKIYIKWMTCSSCVALNESSIKKIYWVNNIQINLSSWQANIDFNSNITDIEIISQEIISNWFWVEFTKKESDIDESQKYLQKFKYSFILGLPVFSMMFIDTMIWYKILGVDISMWIFLVLTFIIVFILWFHFHKSFFSKLKKLQFNMDSLVSLWTLSAFFYSSYVMFIEGEHVYFEAAVAIITLINLWKYFESKSKKTAWDAISKLLELWVKQAHVIRWDSTILTDIWDIKIWDIVQVFPGEKIPLDGIIIKWESSIDESMLTGESIPLEKTLNYEVFWATINLDNYLEIKVTKKSKDGMLSQIVEMVNNAQSSKAPIQKLVDKISQIFVPIIIWISIITFISWYIISWDSSQAILAAVATLVIACPCALWLATPAAIMVATGSWAKQWILIKNAETLEKTKDIDIVIFDKTGTLTNGKPEISDIIHISWIETENKNIASSLAKLSHHPLSKTIYWNNSENIINFISSEEIKWKWLSWEYNWKKYFLWNKKIFSEKLMTSHILELLDTLTSEWKTPVIFWNSDEILSIYGLLDLSKKWVKNVIQQLHEMNIKTCMLTWDTKNTAEYIAKNIWINVVISEVMPADKLEVIKKYQSEWKKVAFVWDGINDAPALTQADLSIAMWTWSDIAIESSDIVLVWWNVEKVQSAIKLSRKTLSIIKQNLFWAFLYNSIWIPLAAFWLLNPIFAAFAMSMSSVSVIMNSLRLKK